MIIRAYKPYTLEGLSTPREPTIYDYVTWFIHELLSACWSVCLSVWISVRQPLHQRTEHPPSTTKIRVPVPQVLKQIVNLSCLIWISLHMAVTYWNESVRRDMFQVCSPDGAGINSFKMFMAYKDVFMLRDNEMLECMKTCRQIGALAQVSKITISYF